MTRSVWRRGIPRRIMANQSRLQVLHRVPRYLGAARERVMKAGRRCILGAVLYFNLTILASLLVRTVLSHLCLPFLPTMRSSLVAVLLTALNPREKDAGEQNGF